MRQSAACGYGDAFADAEQKFYGQLCSDEENRLNIVIGRTDSVCDLCKALSNRYDINCDDPRSDIAEKDRSELAERNLTPGSYKLRQLTLRYFYLNQCHAMALDWF